MSFDEVADNVVCAVGLNDVDQTGHATIILHKTHASLYSHTSTKHPTLCFSTTAAKQYNPKCL